MSVKKPRILFYDIETRPLMAWVWGSGKQFVSHKNFVKGHDRYDIICIGYAWSDTGESGILDWGFHSQESGPMIEEFTKMCDEADMVIGKNNKRFDDKHVNTLRMLKGLDGRPDLMTKVDDLETQMRKHFYLPSYSLDYFSNLLGFGGKDSVAFTDWINIVMKDKEKGLDSYKKMLDYCEKDVKDTMELWHAVEKHFKPKLNRSVMAQEVVCSNCGSKNIRKNGTRYYGQTLFQHYFCKDHGGYAGRAPIQKNRGKVRN